MEAVKYTNVCTPNSPIAYRTLNTVKEQRNKDKANSTVFMGNHCCVSPHSQCLTVNVQATSQSKPVVKSDSSIQGQEIDVQKEDGIYEEGFLCFEFITHK